MAHLFGLFALIDRGTFPVQICVQWGPHIENVYCTADYTVQPPH